MKRTPIPLASQRTILVASRRRCCLCYFLDANADRQQGQIAHIDRNASNSAESNLAYLCLKCHNEYDTQPRQTKRITPDELRAAKESLEAYVKEELPQQVLATAEANSKEKCPPSVSVETYKIRYPVYEAFERFAISILRDLKTDPAARIAFLKATSQAYFLFGEEIESYLSEVHRKSLALARVERILEKGPDAPQEQWEKACAAESEIVLWFEEQLQHGKRIFGKYLTIDS